MELIVTYGRQLLKARPKMFTSLMINLCTAKYAQLIPEPSSDINNKENSVSGVELLKMLSKLTVDKILIPTDPIDINQVMKVFVDDNEHLLLLLEGVVDSLRGRRISNKLASTLMELYLVKYSSISDQIYDNNMRGEPLNELQTALKIAEGNVMSVLDGATVQYDPAHALMLTYQFNFEKGQRFLLEKQHAIDLLLHMLMENGDNLEIFKILRREGSKDPELYVRVLTHFVQRSIRGEESNTNKIDDDGDSDDEYARWDPVIEVMDMLEKEAVLSPAQVLSILSLNPELPLHIASSFILKSIREVSEEVEQLEDDVKVASNNLRSIAHLRKLERQIGSTSGKTAVGGNSDAQYDEDDEDDVDIEYRKELERKEQEKWKDIRKKQLECSLDHEGFYTELDRSADGFSTVATFFGRSLINPYGE